MSLNDRRRKAMQIETEKRRLAGELAKIELGPGEKPKDGFLGLDIVEREHVYAVLDFEKDELPFEDNSVGEVFSAHCWEHIENPRNILNELARVCADGAQLEIWMPYGHSNDALVLGHRQFYTELTWTHFCQHYPGSWFDHIDRRLLLNRIRYNLLGGVQEELERMKVPIPYALRHYNNVAWEFGVFLEADKRRRQPPTPESEFGYGRERVPYLGQLVAKP